MKAERLASQYYDELRLHVIPFWSRYSVDYKYGGYLTCILPDGRIYDHDKFIWLQARQVWMYCTLIAELGKNDEWAEIAKHGGDFLINHGRDKEGNWYFQTDRRGQPIVAAYNIFSDCFAAMAFAKLYELFGGEEYREVATQTWSNILARQDNPKGKYNKRPFGTRVLKNLSLPMIKANMSLIMKTIPGITVDKEQLSDYVQEVLSFVDEYTGVLIENKFLDGSNSDSFEGRIINPGHVLESLWFLIDICDHLDTEEYNATIESIAQKTLEVGWDEKYGGFYYFLDRKGYPPEQLEWNQKLWWVHLEAMICMLKLYKMTGNRLYWDWFVKIHEWSWHHFRDSQYGGEWFGYLDREGKVLLELKGGKWKGCFHTPRALLIIHKELSTLSH